ncbi:MAG: hypothetical protein IT266_01900 [Saprospiraceae bacterium]|nr:hypothetical protein [Saprospiraceae bacterium]
MKFSEIKAYCGEMSALSRKVLDDNLLYYFAIKENLGREADALEKKYKRVVRTLPKSYLGSLKAEYIAHRIFKKGGYIAKYLNRPEIRDLPGDQYAFLEVQSLKPWRYSFAEIIHKPEDEFFEMQDVMTGERYLLYSPGMKATEAEFQPRMWFILISFNGQCWQTYGLIIPFRVFTADDIIFFASELNAFAVNEDLVTKEVEHNPYPFFMLLSAAVSPAVVSRGHLILHLQATDVVKQLPAEKLNKQFSSKRRNDVFRFTHVKMGEFPHYAIAYYNQHNGDLRRTALTEAGFLELTKALKRAGCDLSEEPDVAVSLVMLSTAETILNKKITLNPYEGLFRENEGEGISEESGKLNHFMELAASFYNNKKDPDINKLAAEAGIDKKTAWRIWEQVTGKPDPPNKT